MYKKVTKKQAKVLISLNISLYNYCWFYGFGLVTKMCPAGLVVVGRAQRALLTSELTFRYLHFCISLRSPGFLMKPF